MLNSKRQGKERKINQEQEQMEEIDKMEDLNKRTDNNIKCKWSEQSINDLKTKDKSAIQIKSQDTADCYL